MTAELIRTRRPVALQAPAQEHLSHPAVLDAVALLCRHLGDDGAVDALVHTGAGRTNGARGGAPLNEFARLNTPYAAWARAWRALAAHRPDRFAWHPGRLGAGASPFSLAFLYARAHYPRALRPLELTSREQEGLRSARRLLRSLTGMRGYESPCRNYEFTANCVPFRAVPSLAGGAGYSAWSYAEEPRLRRHAVFSLNDLRSRRSLPGGYAEVAALVSHEETHAAAAAAARPGEAIHSSPLCLWVEESFVTLAELVVEHYLICGTLPGPAALAKAVSMHGYADAASTLLTLFDAEETTAERLQRGARLMVDVLRDAEDDGSAAGKLNEFSGVQWTPERWRAAFVPVS